TMKVTALLLPGGFPSELSCVATAVYCPLESAGLALPDAQAPPVPGAVAVATTAPEVGSPAWRWMVRVVVSVAASVKDGVVLVEGDFRWRNVTVGEVVSTMNVRGWLTPEGFPSELSCVATAVYWPLERAGLALPDTQAPLVPGAVALDTTAP